MLLRHPGSPKGVLLIFRVKSSHLRRSHLRSKNLSSSDLRITFFFESLTFQKKNFISIIMRNHTVNQTEINIANDKIIKDFTKLFKLTNTVAWGIK